MTEREKSLARKLEALIEDYRELERNEGTYLPVDGFTFEESIESALAIVSKRREYRENDQ